MNMSLMWVYAAVFTPLIITLIAGYLAIKDYIRNSLIKSGK